MENIDQHERELAAKIEDVEQQLAEVEDVLAEQPPIPTRRVHLEDMEQQTDADEQGTAI